MPIQSTSATTSVYGNAPRSSDASGQMLCRGSAMQPPAWALKSPFCGLHVHGQGPLLCCRFPGVRAWCSAHPQPAHDRERGSLPHRCLGPMLAGAGSGSAPQHRSQGLLHPPSCSWGVGRAAREQGQRFLGEGRETRQKLGRSDCRVAIATARRRWTNTIGTCKVNPAASRQQASIHSPLHTAGDLPGTAPGFDPRELWGDLHPPSGASKPREAHPCWQIPGRPHAKGEQGRILRRVPWTSRTCRSVSTATISPWGYSS